MGVYVILLLSFKAVFMSPMMPLSYCQTGGFVILKQ